MPIIIDARPPTFVQRVSHGSAIRHDLQITDDVDAPINLTGSTLAAVLVHPAGAETVLAVTVDNAVGGLAHYEIGGALAATLGAPETYRVEVVQTDSLGVPKRIADVRIEVSP